MGSAPKSYKDVFDPKLGNKLAIIDIQYQYTLVCAALAAGGTISNLETGKKLLLECKKAGMRMYPTNEAFAQGLKAEEFSTGVMWKARVVQWQNAGISVDSVALPRERSPISRASSSQERPEQGWRLRISRRHAGEERAGRLRCRHGLHATVTNAVVAPDLVKRIGFTPAEEKRSSTSTTTT